MIKILFLCHGNICRSPMAQFIFSNLAQKQGLADKFQVYSAAVTMDEIGPAGFGSPLDPRTVRELEKNHIPYQSRNARIMTREDYQQFDYLICMDEENFLDMNRIAGGDPKHKEYKLLQFTGSSADIDDPWYTGDFTTAFKQIKQGCQALLEKLR